MKRFLTTLTALLMAAVLCCAPGFAAAEPAYYLEEMDVSIALPDWESYYYLYPDMAEGNSDLADLDMTPEQVNELLAPNGILLDVVYYDFSHEITANVTEDQVSAEVYNYRELSSLEREIVLGVSSSMYAGTGVELNSVQWMERDNALWLVTDFTIPGQCLCRQYNTAYNGKNLYLNATLYLVDGVDTSLWSQVCAVADAMAAGTVFHTTEVTPEGVGGITGNLVSSVLEESGMDSIDLTEAGLGKVELKDVDLSGLDLDGVVDALGLTEEEAVSLVKGEMDPSQLDLSKADPAALMAAIGMETGDMVDVALSAIGLGGLDWKGILAGAGRGALIGAGAGVVVVIVIIVLLAVTGRKKKAAQAASPNEEEL